MKGDRLKIFLIYLLMIIIVGLIGYLIYFVMTQNKPQTIVEKEETKTISQSCTFDVTMVEANNISRDPNSLDLCNGYNKLNVKDILLGGQNSKIHIIYYNGTQTDKDDDLGIYLNDKQITVGASYDDKYAMGIFDNLLFIKEDNETTNVVAYNSQGIKVYDLVNALTKTKIDDPALQELNKIDNTVSSIVAPKNIDKDSFNFITGSFSFNTTSNCQGQTHKGSTYTVKYENGNFNNPTFVSFVDC